LSPWRAAALGRLLRTVNVRLTEFHRQAPPNPWRLETEAELRTMVDELTLEGSEEELLFVVNRFIDAKVGEARLAVVQSYAERLSELEALRRKVEPQRLGLAVLERDSAMRLDHVNAVRMHASDTLADPSRAPLDSRNRSWNEDAR
jgi:hypothetical protein